MVRNYTVIHLRSRRAVSSANVVAFAKAFANDATDMIAISPKMLSSLEKTSVEARKEKSGGQVLIDSGSVLGPLSLSDIRRLLQQLSAPSGEEPLAKNKAWWWNAKPEQ